MHVETSIEVIKAILIQILVKERVSVHGSIHSVVAHDIWVKLQPRRASCIVFGVGAVTRPGVDLSYCIVHVNHVLVVRVVVVHQCSIVHTARRIYHIARQQRALVKVSAGTGHANGFFGGGMELDHHS